MLQVGFASCGYGIPIAKYFQGAWNDFLRLAHLQCIVTGQPGTPSGLPKVSDKYMNKSQVVLVRSTFQKQSTDLLVTSDFFGIDY